MAKCPRCSIKLSAQMTPDGTSYACGRCGGAAVSLPVLRRSGVTEEFLDEVRQQAAINGRNGQRRCPQCLLRMAEVRVTAKGRPFAMDACPTCGLLWAHPSEFQQAPRGPRPPAPKPASPKFERPAIHVSPDPAVPPREETDSGSLYDSPSLLGGLAGGFVVLNQPKRARPPLATWTIALICVLITIPVFAQQLQGLAEKNSVPQIIEDLGFTPARCWQYAGLTLITSFFLHGGLLHLASNMYFLLLLGGAVEDRLGWKRFLFLLTGAHLAGLLLHALFDGRPVVGASAGICGIMAYYAIVFPNVRVAVLLGGYQGLAWLRVSAFAALGLFAGAQILLLATQSPGEAAVSVAGHIGGLIVGVFAGAYAQLMNPESGRAGTPGGR